MGHRLAPVKRGDALQRDLLDVTADRAFEEVHRHPRLETGQQGRFDVRVRGQVEIEAVGKRIAQGLQPPGRGRVRRPRLVDGHVQPRTHVAVDRRLAIDLRQAPGGPDVVAFDAREVVFGLRVQHAEHGIGIGLAVHVRHPEVVADDLHLGGACREALQFRVAGRRRRLLLRGTGGEYDQYGEQRRGAGGACH